jgi:hypothetical protein
MPYHFPHPFLQPGFLEPDASGAISGPSTTFTAPSVRGRLYTASLPVATDPATQLMTMMMLVAVCVLHWHGLVDVVCGGSHKLLCAYVFWFARVCTSQGIEYELYIEVGACVCA